MAALWAKGLRVELLGREMGSLKEFCWGLQMALQKDSRMVQTKAWCWGHHLELEKESYSDLCLGFQLVKAKGAWSVM
jgi:hypothetical protein